MEFEIQILFGGQCLSADYLQKSFQNLFDAFGLIEKYDIIKRH